MVSLMVIADDLTGANDTGVKFAQQGFCTEILVHPDEEIASVEGPVCVADTESRHTSPEEAAARVERVARRGVELGVESFYKKTDSTLRGNVGAELAALMRATGVRILPFVPAFPAAGRTTRSGRQYVHGRPIHETSYAADPRAPVRSSLVAEIIAAQSPMATVSASIRDIGAACPWTGAEPCICVFDAETEDDLDCIATYLAEREMLTCCAGAGGFAEHVAPRLGLRTSAVERPARRGPIVFVNGSLEETALRQVRCAMEAGVRCLGMPPEAVLADDCLHGPGGDAVEAACEALRGGHDVLLYTVTEAGEQRRYREHPAARTLADVPETVAAGLGALAGAIASQAESTGALAVFGGDTTVAVMRALGCTRMRPLIELWPGVVEALVEFRDHHLTFITKSGGFGPDDVVPQLMRMYSEDRSQPCASE
jgi:uncharacterized protein YgbK (DUF1537 family)